MLVVGVCSLKGGVGKTSVVLGLASAALSRDLPTLVVDLDPQSDATTGLDVVSNRPCDLVDVFHRPRRRVLEQAVGPSGWTADSPGRIDVLTGARRLLDPDVDRAVDLAGTRPTATALGQALGRLPAPYDLVLIDCPPNLGALTRAGLGCADGAVIVCEPGLFAVAAADRSMQVLEELRAQPEVTVRPLGVVVNRYKARHREHAYRVRELRELFGGLVLEPVLPERSVLEEAQGAGRPIHDWPTSPARTLAAQFDDLLTAILHSAHQPPSP